METFPIGVQLWSLHDQAQHDLAGTLRAVAAMGYDGVEFAGLYGNDPRAIRVVLDDAGLVPLAAHLTLEDVDDRLDATIEDLHTLGCGRAVVAWLPPELYEGRGAATQTVARLVDASRRFAAAGLAFGYHNHAFEFQQFDGPPLWDLLVDAGHPLPLEVDVYWVRHAGVDPAVLLRELGSRVCLLHAKDTSGKPGADSCAIGDGVEDWPAVLEACRTGGVEWLVVEQEHGQDIAADLRRSVRALRKLGA